MSKTCKHCGVKFDSLIPIQIPFIGTFCSYKCKYLYYSEGKDIMKHLNKFIWKFFTKKNGRIQKILNGEYNLSTIYSTYLYFLNRTCENYKNLIIDEFDFPYLFIEIFKEKKHLELEIIARTTENSPKLFVNKYHDPREKGLPFGEELFYVEKDGQISQRFQNVLIDEDKCIELQDQKEKELEQFLVKSVNENNGICWKLAASSPGCSGVPDRVVIMPNNRIGFVEVKRPDGTQKPRPNQIKQLKILKKKTEHVYVLDNPNQIEGIIKDIEFNQHLELRWEEKC